jgi:hypothetical protein
MQRGLADRRGASVTAAGHHPQQSVLKPQAGHLHTACIRYISAPQRSHTVFSTWRSTVTLSDVIGRGVGLS